jgi:hypothetical protein
MKIGVLNNGARSQKSWKDNMGFPAEMASNADSAIITTSRGEFLKKNGPYKKKTSSSISTPFMAIDGHSSPNSYQEDHKIVSKTCSTLE